jgi:iron complex outermembrane receptor protein
MSRHLKTVVSALALSVAMIGAAAAQSADEAIVVTGVRAQERSELSSPVPVDVFTADDLANAGAVGNEVGQALAVIAPSFNFPRQSNSGTSDHIRAGQLRGLSPDQTLVLVNGRRRHQSAVVNSETKIGRGTAAVDFNTIPIGAVGRIEVLRDGAGAQYGSDAIAGVVNIILDSAPEGAELTASYGEHLTDLEPVNQEITDGETLNFAAELGVPLGNSGGFIRAGWEALDRRGTNRAGFDQIPFFENQTPVNLALQGRRNYAIGDADTQAHAFWYNAEVPAGGVTLYSFATFNDRASRGGAAFLRYPDSFQNILSVYPNGYRPETRGDNEDLAVSGGARFALGRFDADFGLTFGRNEFEFGVENSLNPSLGPTSPTSFDSGGYAFEQTSANLDLSTDFAPAFFEGPLTLAFGVELRREGFETEAGDPASFAAGAFPLAIGAQAAPGLTPADVVDIERDVAGVYVDLSGDVTSRLFVNVAARYEDYDDFGDTLTGKLSGLFVIADGWNIRAAVSNSFRAPGLQQVGFSDTTLNFGTGGSLVRTRTLRQSDPIAQALGVQALDPEESLNYSLGLTAQPTAFLTFTVDAFRIEVDDRITLSDRFFGSALEAFIAPLPGGATTQSVRFFTNAIDTETQGVDVVANADFDAFAGDLGLSLAYSYAETEITRFAPTPAALLGIDPSFRLVGVEERNTIETAAPTDKLVATATWSNERLRLLLRGSYYGEATRVFNFGGGFEPMQVYGSETQLDAEAEWNLTPEFSVTVGGTNLLDEYPDLSSSDINYFGNLPYDILSPIGINGRFLYVRARVRL